MRQYTYDVVIEKDPLDGGYVVHVPALPGCYSDGETIEEALENIRDAITGYLHSLIQHGDNVPPNERFLLTQAVSVEIAA